MHYALLISGLLIGAAAPEQPVLSPVEGPSVPPVMPTELAEPVLPGEFLDKALKVDSKNRITMGRAQTPVTHLELFTQLGRGDLIAKSEMLALRRKWLIIGGVGLGSAAIVTGIILIATAPKLASIYCESSVRIYNDICVPRANEHNISGTAIIVTGVLGALLMAGFAYNSDPRAIDADETAALVGTFNSKLARELRRPPAGIRFLPVVTPDGASLTASLRF